MGRFSIAASRGLIVIAAGFAALGGCDMFEKKVDAPSPYAFSMPVTLTPDADAAMHRRQYKFRVSLFYYGFAKPEYAAQADVLNRISLGHEVFDYALGAKRFDVPAREIDRSKLGQVVGGEVWVLTSVSSLGKDGFPTELLECSSYTGTLAVVQSQPSPVSCGVRDGYN